MMVRSGFTASTIQVRHLRAITDDDLGSATVTIKGNQDCTNIPGETVKRCFDISPANIIGRNTTVTFYFSANELSGNTCSSLDAYHWNGSSWDVENTTARSCASEPYSLPATGVSDFSPFVLKSSSPNAVTLRSFRAGAADGSQGTGVPGPAGSTGPGCRRASPAMAGPACVARNPIATNKE